MIKWKLLTTKEKIWYSIWCICGFLVKPFNLIGNWSADKLNKSYFSKELLTNEDK
jgi:hypothetical protein